MMSLSNHGASAFFSISSILSLLINPTTASPPDPSTLWAPQSPLNYSDPLYCGWPQVPAVKHTQVYNGVDLNRTYAHHPELYAVGSSIYLIFSSAAVDEDSMGQDVWLSVSHDTGMTWSSAFSIFPPAFLPNQTAIGDQTYAYWCEKQVAQRAWQANTFVHLPPSPGSPEGELYAIAQSGTRWCPGAFRAAGTMARRLSLAGEPLDDPCWIEQTELTVSQKFNETIYGTKYGMKMCKRACHINSILRKPEEAPAWTTWLYNTILNAADGVHSMQENTFSVWIKDAASSTGGYWQRFWRDISGSADITHKVWVEYNEDVKGRGWYPRVKQALGNAIFETNIPDAGTKQFFGKTGAGDRYLIWNPKWNATAPHRQPLTVAMAKGGDLRFTKVGVLRTGANTEIVPDTRNGIKNRAYGFSYPTAVIVGDKLIASYSENKENIWVSVVDVNALP